MKIKLDINEKYAETEIIIKTNKITNEVKEIVDFVDKKKPDHFIGIKDEKTSIIKPNEVFTIYAQQGKVFLETEKDIFEIRIRLYEVLEYNYSSSFIRISKSEIINMEKIDFFESDITGSIVIVLKNKKRSYVSKRYTKNIKERLGV